MGEYENWVRKKAAEDEARKKQQVQNDATMHQSRLTSMEHAKSARKAEYERVLFPIANKIQSFFEDALRIKFRTAKEHKIDQYRQTYGGEYPIDSYISVVAKWGEKLELSSAEKSIIEGKSGSYKPKKILGCDYYTAGCTIRFDYIDGGIPIEDFQRNSNVIFDYIHKEVNNPTHQSDIWVLEKDGRYATEFDNSRRYQSENQGYS